MVMTRLAVVSLSMAALLGGCSSSDSNGVPGAPTGRLQVGLTDQAGDYRAVVLTVERVVVIGSDGSAAATIELVPPRTFDLVELAFRHVACGPIVELEAGAYHELRLVLAPNTNDDNPANYVVLSTNPEVKVPLTAPSGQASGLKLNGRFEVEADGLSVLVLDIDPARAIVEAGASGMLLLKPTAVRLVQVQALVEAYGAISGTVGTTAAWADGLVEVRLFATGEVIATTTVDTEDGSYRVTVPAGVYVLRVTSSATNPLTTEPITVVAGAEVVAEVIILGPVIE